MQQLNPSITIIVASLNNAKTLLQTIDSVANQTYQNAELIVIDGGSSDGSVDLLKQNANKISYWVSEIDNGIYSAWNKGLERATGDWICFLGADDFLWNLEVLKNISQLLSSLPDEILVAYGEEMLLTIEGEPLYKVGRPWNLAKNQFVKYMSIPHVGLMHRSSIFKKNGNFDESFRIAGDYELLLRELKNADAAFIPIIIAGARLGGISCNSDNSFKLLREVRRAQVKHGFNVPSLALLMSAISLLIRKIVWYSVGEYKARKFFDFSRRVMGRPSHWTKI